MDSKAGTKEIGGIKKRMVDVDSILTEEDYVSLNDYCRDIRCGKLVSHKDLKKELGL
jgi:hypothetical protein